MAARSSISRCTALATSTGCSSDLKARAKAPSTIPSSRRSKRCRPRNVPPPFPSHSPDRICGAGALGSVLTYSLPGAGGGTADAHGSGPCVRKDVRVQIPPRPRVTPSCSLAFGQFRHWPAVPARGDDPPEPPAWPAVLLWLGADGRILLWPGADGRILLWPGADGQVRAPR